MFSFANQPSEGSARGGQHGGRPSGGYSSTAMSWIMSRPAALSSAGIIRGRFARGSTNNAPRNYSRGQPTRVFGGGRPSVFDSSSNTSDSTFQPHHSFNPWQESGNNMTPAAADRGGFNQDSVQNTNDEIKEKVTHENAPPVKESMDLPVFEDDKLVFGEDIQQNFAGHKLPRNRAEAGYAPIARGADEMFAEDDKYAADYDAVANEDEPIEIIGLPGKLRSLHTWADFNLDERLLENVERANYRCPRKIQCAAIPIILEYFDLICHTETGSGKTLSYLLPIFERCIDDKRIKAYSSKPFVPYAVILQPTRELCLQCFEQAIKFADGTGITVAKAYGEYDVQKNKKELSRTCDILIACPGRFEDFTNRQYIILNECRFLVFDEGDQLLGDDFKKTIDHAILFCKPKIYPKRQTLFFSATINDYARMNAKFYMRGGKGVVEVKNKACAPSKKCEQVFKVVRETGKFGVVLNYLRAELGKVEKDAQPRTIIFCHSTQHCEKLAIGLEFSGIIALPLVGSRGQDLREEALKKFRDGEVKILCVSDVGSRGLDVKDVDLVVQFDMAYRYDIYVNRVGRTGRIRHGKCVSFVDLEKDRHLLYQIKKAMEEAGQDIPQSLDDAVGDFNPSAGFGFKNFNENAFGAASLPSFSSTIGNVEPSLSSEVIENVNDYTMKKEDEHEIDSASVANETVKPTTSFAPPVEAEPLVEEKPASFAQPFEAEPEVEEKAASSAPPVEAQPDVEEKAGLPPAKEVVKVPATEDVPSTTPQVPAQVVQCDSAFEDLIQKMTIAMKEAGIADEVIEDTVTAARAKHHVAASVANETVKPTTSFAPPVEAEPEVEEKAASFAQPFEAEPDVEEKAASFAPIVEAEPHVEEKAASFAPIVEAEPLLEEKAVSFAPIVEAEPLVEEKAASSAPPVEAEPDVEEKAVSFAPIVEAEPLVEEKAVSFAPIVEAEPLVEEKAESSVPTVEAEPLLEEKAVSFAPIVEAEPLVEEKAASFAPIVEAEPEVEEKAASFAQPFEAEPDVEEKAASFAQPFEAEPDVEEKAASFAPIVEAQPDVEEKAASFAPIVEAEPLVEEKAESSVPTVEAEPLLEEKAASFAPIVEAEPEVEEKAESSVPTVEAQPDVEEKAGLPPTKEVIEVPATEDVPSTTPQVPAQVVQCDSAFEDLIQKMKIAMKEAGVADEVIEVTAAVLRDKHRVAAAHASTQEAPKSHVAADASTQQASPRDEGNVPGNPPVFPLPVFRPPVFDFDDGWN